LQKTADFAGANEVITIDGLRVEYPDGFGLMRPSNTTPVIVLRFEADNEAALNAFKHNLKKSFGKPHHMWPSHFSALPQLYCV
jgi:phosphomannomutase / phosphoglucomutase